MKTDLEARANVESLDDLHAQRRDILAMFAPLKAMHGAFGLYDARRKALLEGLKVRTRERLMAANAKVTDAIVDAEAHNDPTYVAWLDEQFTDKVRYVQLEVEMDEIAERIRNRELSLQIFNSEVKLAR
ncbi:MAG: hypothetical protein A4C66_04115 [Nitrospira sp. HN-bin3]|uniref:hypothetical protein n=1 Tax=Nitrospira cf. moscoviensis SBR1015 TaxID=96242 RepID=UPI000A09C27B|nr:hypothetical protein [Nitrospira cf. moscoviensis SBR1015]OQW33317.1 MAG: hypothetical protein A4C66_04115 [Nitrospira sp. HN-bin3]